MLGMALVLFSVVLYFGTQYFLLTPIETDAALHAHTHAKLWLTGSLDRACPFLVSSNQSGSSPALGLPLSERVVCFDQHGSRLAGEHTTGLPAAFLSTTLAKRALETGQPSTDTVDAGGSVGQIYRYALPVPSPTGKGYVGVVVIGDPALLEQAVLALLDNAINYNRPGGRVMVRTAVKDEQALLEVEDTGIGIATEYLAHLGERFYRVDKARSREAGGTGLGLSIVRSIARAHGGTLTSIPEQGTTATLTLPLAHRTASARRDDAPGNVSALPTEPVASAILEGDALDLAKCHEQK